MKKKILLSLLPPLILLGIFAFVWLKPSPASSPEPPSTPLTTYTFGPKSIDGIGKFYLGREISHVMGHPALNWLERDERESEEAPSLAMKLLQLRENETLADIGAGSGYYSLRLAQQLPKGKIIALDIQPEMLAFIENRKARLALENLTTHLGQIESVDLPPNSIDSALLVDAYHEFSHPYEMMSSIKKALRPGGRIFLLEYRAEDPNVPIKPLHKMTEAQAIKEMAHVGLRWEKTLHDLPWQHLMIFRKP